ncbi:hypothetical protein CRG98_023974 [Punica granatum]|uniref:Uncharacterized protein n=1 Tax=Punica granatum TaxID=22663 RepID=A0A2I0JI33_PUNGR|nr:hypothetical protein CRG98_023974 [Punica granatum]
MESPNCAHPNFVSLGHACARLCNAAWECPPSRGRATDAREKKSLLPVYDPKIEGRGCYSYALELEMSWEMSRKGKEQPWTVGCLSDPRRLKRALRRKLAGVGCRGWFQQVGTVALDSQGTLGHGYR